MVPERVPPTHQLSRAKGVLSGLENLSQRQVSRNRIPATRQHDCYCLHQQQRGYTFLPTHDSGIRNVGLVSGKGHPRDRFSNTRKRQRLSGQGVHKIHGHERVEVRPNNYSALPAELSDRSICESPHQSTCGLHQLETRPRSHSRRHLHNKLGYSTGLCLPSLQSDIEDPDEVHNRPYRTNSRRPSPATSALVAGSVETPDISASVAPEQSTPVNRPDRPELRSSNVSSSSLGRVSHLYQRFEAEGIPTNVADLLITATRYSTHKTYESSWNRWCRWCSRQQINPLSSSLSGILVLNRSLQRRLSMPIT